MTPEQLLALAQSSPEEFKRIFAERLEARRAARRERYAANPTIYRAQAQRWRDLHRESERDRARRTSAREKALKSLYQQMKEAA